MSKIAIAHNTKISFAKEAPIERAVLYARVSSDDRGKDGRNLAGQLEMGRKYALDKGYIIMEELHEDDRGASGHDIDLPQLNKVREMAQLGQFDVLIVRELDRLSRNLAKQLIVEEELRRAGVRVEYVLAEYDDTPEGRLQKHIRATVAEYEREKIKERMVRGKWLKVKDGNVNVSDRPPYGYMVAKNNGKTEFEIVEDQAQIVKLIFRLCIEGDENRQTMSTHKIAKKLTKMEVPTPGVRAAKNQGQWSRQTIHRILTNETYAGIWHYGKESNKKPISVSVPAIIDRETWEDAQLQLKLNKQDSRRNMKHKYLFSKRITCGCCGYRISGFPKKIGDKMYRYYYRTPSSKSIDYKKSCHSPYFPAEKVDEIVWNWIKSFLTDPAALERGLGEYQIGQDKEATPLKERLKVVDDLLLDNRQQLERLLDLYLAGDFPKDLLTERKSRLETTIKKLEKERTGLVTRLEAQTLSHEQIRNIKDFTDKVREKLEELEHDFEGRRRIIEMLDIEVTLAIEDGQKIAYVRGILGEERLPFVSKASRRR